MLTLPILLLLSSLPRARLVLCITVSVSVFSVVCLLITFNFTFILVDSCVPAGWSGTCVCVQYVTFLMQSSTTWGEHWYFAGHSRIAPGPCMLACQVLAGCVVLLILVREVFHGIALCSCDCVYRMLPRAGHHRRV